MKSSYQCPVCSVQHPNLGDFGNETESTHEFHCPSCNSFFNECPKGFIDETKSCFTCLYRLTRDKCENSINCLGTTKECELNNVENIFKHWQPGDAKQRLLEFQRAGKKNIIIGGTGEAEINALRSPEETLQELKNISEECGYITKKGFIWTNSFKQILIANSAGVFIIIYINNCFNSIYQEIYSI